LEKVLVRDIWVEAKIVDAWSIGGGPDRWVGQFNEFELIDGQIQFNFGPYILQLSPVCSY
jgi:hypothetical protein